ncbi:hypothetical protein HDR66_01975 [bacterium]|nr:hypothetical protein [bacterium]
MKFKFTVPYILTGGTILGGGLQLGTAQEQTVNATVMALPVMATYSSNTIMENIEKSMPKPEPKVIEMKNVGRNVMYIMDDGTQILRRDGSRAWINNNPGNLRLTNRSREFGAIGAAGGFAVFPDEETGHSALHKLLQSDAYRDMTIERAIFKFAPPVENSTTDYVKKLGRMTKLPVSKKLCELDSAQIENVVHTIKILEGWRPGTIEESQAPAIAKNNTMTPDQAQQHANAMWQQMATQRD